MTEDRPPCRELFEAAVRESEILFEGRAIQIDGLIELAAIEVERVPDGRAMEVETMAGPTWLCVFCVVVPQAFQYRGLDDRIVFRMVGSQICA